MRIKTIGDYAKTEKTIIIKNISKNANMKLTNEKQESK